ncbi:hypothetical protein TRSA_01050 [Treponema saccharophilum]|uniref:Uncharacterized protein n=1 Tax=Treponema saccharophilum DSM 2985 TaxID=907348 RepID=H7EPR9_9SPIR|nr:hypothetical protein TresaDRAFT_0564 [Treponema saccharophilum DSM 2985]BDC95006.1 hypothetical protein TRSA_01050 [Treponema saccharophilum]
MFSYIWPILLIVTANTVYQICAKGIPQAMNTDVSLLACLGQLRDIRMVFHKYDRLFA